MSCILKEESAKREESIFSDNVAESTLSEADASPEVVAGTSTGISKVESTISQIAEEDEKEEQAQVNVLSAGTEPDANEDAAPVEEVKSAQSGAFAQDGVLSDVVASPTDDAPVALSKSNSAEPEPTDKQVSRDAAVEGEVTVDADGKDSGSSNMKVVNESIEKLGALCFCV